MTRHVHRSVLAVVLAASAALLVARPASAQQPQTVERPIAFDAAGRVLVLTPPVAARWKLAAPDWPLGSDWKEARLYQVNGSAVLVAQLVNGNVARYTYTADALTRLRALVDAAVVAQGTGGGGRGETGLEMSQPAGNTFVRNQVLLGLFAYGPATAALLSNSGGAAAGGGYLVAAGSSYFVASQLIRTRTVTRAQASLASHGGTRGAAIGAGIAAIANADGGPGWGAPILAGAIGGTVVGFRRARPMSDGEAAASGLAADLAAVTAFGINGMLGAFDEKTERIPEPGEPIVENDNLETKAKVAIASAIGAGVAGYLIGPRYARRASYNVTAGDVSMVYTGAMLGAMTAVSTLPDDVAERTGFAVTTVGVLGGALLADRFMVRRADRTSGDGTLAQLGAVAGGLMGGGIALMARADRQVAMALIASGGTAGLVLADRSIGPAPDAGPVGGVLTTGAMMPRRDARLSLSVVQAATTLGIGLMQPANGREVRAPIGRVTF